MAANVLNLGCVADDAFSTSHVGGILDEYAQQDPRIQVVRRGVQGHISAASNSALAQVGGEFIVVLNDDDLLLPHALAEVAAAIAWWDRAQNCRESSGGTSPGSASASVSAGWKSDERGTDKDPPHGRAGRLYPERKIHGGAVEQLKDEPETIL